ncbi:hypothetical protein H6F67_23950 [Microcoleus sp. FACHB-1515]|uniref:hypothetical protein n=1 Tax=Cyanophyceae TaxID=3028117 RepID=UPI0016829DD0|nr:hypothetical protein [Microcoleus sp. FACHB-1515]MBD2092906.1 hypothetical protein [Microcoleus sp. FACHB-1515]
MKVNSTLALTLVLLTAMVGAGVVSAAWGYAVGGEALKGVTQPNGRVGHNLAGRDTPQRQPIALLKETDILRSVRAQMSGDAEPEPDRSSSEQNKAAIEVATNPAAEPSAAPTAGFPLMSQTEGVTLAVQSTREENGYLLLNVSLQNSSSKAVQFLYSFMNVTDDQGRAFSANTEGLPGQLPSNSESFTGTVSIPTALLGDAKSLSLTLTDYPNQQLQLQVTNIPIAR